MLSKGSQTQKAAHCGIPFVDVQNRHMQRETQRTLVVAGGWAWGKGVTAHGHRVSLGLTKRSKTGGMVARLCEYIKDQLSALSGCILRYVNSISIKLLF